MFVFSHIQSSLKQTCVCVQKSKVWKWNSSDPVVLLARQPGVSTFSDRWLSLLSVSHPSAASCWSGGTLDPRGTTSPLPAAPKVRKCPQEGHLLPRFFPIYLSGSSEFREQLLASVVRGAQDSTDCRVCNTNGAVHTASFSQITVYHT